jgi:HAD superfamily hydrolase (TIGR01509 family)
LKIKGIIVDMDGTITKFNLDFMSIRRRALAELERMNLRTRDMDDKFGLWVILGKLKEKVDLAAYREIRRMIYNMIEETELKAATEVTIYPGAVDTLQKLRSQSMKIGLVTNNGRKGTDLTLSRFGLTGLFDIVVTRDDCVDMKPDPEPVLKVLEGLNLKASEVVMVGDGVIDILGARAAGVQSVAVATGPIPADQLVEAQPDYLLGSVNDLPTLIESLNAADHGDVPL